MKGTIYKLLQDMQDTLNDAQADALKFDDKGNKAAGRRVRAALMDVKNDAHNLRLEISKRGNK